MDDVLILGAGPAALSLARSCGALGLATRCLAPDPFHRWEPNYGAWVDELAGDDVAWVHDVVQARWPRARVHFRSSHLLERPYVRLSTPELQRRLLEFCEAGGVSMTSGRAASVTHGSTYSVVHLDDGSSRRSRIVVDATGHNGGLLHRQSGRSVAWQTAYAQLVRVRNGHCWPVEEMGLMDYRPPPNPSTAWRETPTFLYAMPFSADVVFLEETSLIHRSGLSMDTLKARLHARIASLGLAVDEVLDEERCFIRMMGPKPQLGQRLLGFGAAAGMVQPATGYLLARMLGEAPQLAKTLANGLGAGLEPSAVSAAGWSTLWSTARKQQWELYGFGAEILCRFDLDDTLDFFEAFFEMRPNLWSGFFSATLPPVGVAEAMTALFFNARATTRRQLIRAGLSREGLRLLQGVVAA